MKTIYKYPIPVDDNIGLNLPMNTIIIDLQEQNSCLYIWAIVDTDLPLELKNFKLYGTGHPITSHQEEYIKTVHLKNGLVFHLFEVIK